jgi:hypothetical protein
MFDITLFRSFRSYVDNNDNNKRYRYRPHDVDSKGGFVAEVKQIILGGR